MRTLLLLLLTVWQLFLQLLSLVNRGVNNGTLATLASDSPLFNSLRSQYQHYEFYCEYCYYCH